MSRTYYLYLALVLAFLLGWGCCSCTRPPQSRVAYRRVDLHVPVKRLGRRAARVLSDPRMRPVEVWAVRALLAYWTVRLGLDLPKP